MKTEDKELVSPDMSEGLLEDVALLDSLERERETNYLEIKHAIRRRHRRRMFLAVACPAAAAALVLLTLIFPGKEGGLDMADDVVVPTLITDSGEKIALEDGESYTLDLLSDSGVPSQDAAVEPVTRGPELEKMKAEGHKETFVAASSVRKSTVVIPQGYTYNILFDDGTQAYLNSGSYIEFPESFAGRDERKVILRGEGYFKVAKSDKPFIVAASGVEIKVYGTEFNVNACKEGKVETILVSGSVGVRESGASEEVIISPGDMLTCDIAGHTTSIRQVDPHDYLAWMRGDFTYTDRPLSELMEEIETFYNISIDGKDGASDMPVTINLSRKLGHRQIMEILELAFGIGFEKTGEKSYTITNFN